jgi:predicted negative regulator of RcsB-dependent stress response
VSTTFEQARRMNTPRAIALCQCFNGALEFQAGHWAEAEAALRESTQLHREIGAASGEALTWQRLGVLQTARGQLAEAMASFEEGVMVAERATMRAHCLTRLYASMTRNRLLAGDLKAADDYLTLGLAMGERHGNCATCDALLFPVAVSVRLAQGDREAAEELCLRLEEAAEKYASRSWVAMARQTRGELAAALGERDQAAACYAEAQAAYAAAGNEYEAARCREELARLQLAADDRGAVARAES